MGSVRVKRATRVDALSSRRAAATRTRRASCSDLRHASDRIGSPPPHACAAQLRVRRGASNANRVETHFGSGRIGISRLFCLLRRGFESDNRHRRIFRRIVRRVLHQHAGKRNRNTNAGEKASGNEGQFAGAGNDTCSQSSFNPHHSARIAGVRNSICSPRYARALCFFPRFDSVQIILNVYEPAKGQSMTMGFGICQCKRSEAITHTHQPGADEAAVHASTVGAGRRFRALLHPHSAFWGFSRWADPSRWSPRFSVTHPPLLAGCSLLRCCVARRSHGHRIQRRGVLLRRGS